MNKSINRHRSIKKWIHGREHVKGPTYRVGGAVLCLVTVDVVGWGIDQGPFPALVECNHTSLLISLEAVVLGQLTGNVHTFQTFYLC